MKTALATLFIIFATTATAQTTSESGSQSNSSSGVVFGDNYNPLQAPSAVAPGNMHTAPCVIGSSAGIGIPGIGVSGGGGRLEEECNTREEVKAISILLNQPPSIAKKAAILHYCNNDSSVRKTLVQLGVCVKKAEAVVKPKQVNYVNPYSFQICKDVGRGNIAYYPNTKAALKECRSFVKRNPGAAIDTINK